MKTKIKLKALLLPCLAMSLLAVTSCSSDDFFGFEDNELDNFDCIVHSEEYIDYLRMVCQFRDSVMESKHRSPDIILSNDTLTAYGVHINLPHNQLQIRHNKLIGVFPEYATLSNNEIRDLLAWIQVDNPSLAEELKLDVKLPAHTKTGNPESDASCAMSYANWNGSQWSITEMPWSLAVLQCRAACSGNKEYGGYAFNDGSGLYIDDSMTSTITYEINDVHYTKRMMHMPVWDWHSYTPIFSFHCHPDQNTSNISMSDDDWAALAAMRSYGCDLMLIIVSDGDYTWRLTYNN